MNDVSNQSSVATGTPLPPQQALFDWVRREPKRDRAAQSIAEWERKDCRACREGTPVEFLSLGNQPPANALLSEAELPLPEKRYPLSVRWCPKCGMVQLGHVVPGHLLYQSYLFFTSTSKRMAAHFQQLMHDAVSEFVPPGGLVVEIGSNDGTALSSIDRRDVRILGIDPARNIAVMAAARGVPTIAEFFGRAIAHEVSRVAGEASLVVACNVFGHIDDLDDVCAGIAQMLTRKGAFVFEVPYLGEMLPRLEYDTIYHEHLSYFAIRPLVALLNRHGLRLERVDFFSVHGGTLRGTAVLGSGVSESVAALVETERARGMDKFEVYGKFAAEVAELGTKLRVRLLALKQEGKRVVGYGAPAKGTVVLNYCDIHTDLLPVLIDSTPAKQNRFVPGTHQHILPPEHLSLLKPDIALLLAWNHAAEIVPREEAFTRHGGRFLTPHLAELP